MDFALTMSEMMSNINGSTQSVRENAQKELLSRLSAINESISNDVEAILAREGSGDPLLAVIESIQGSLGGACHEIKLSDDEVVMSFSRSGLSYMAKLLMALLSAAERQVSDNLEAAEASRRNLMLLTSIISDPSDPGVTCSSEYIESGDVNGLVEITSDSLLNSDIFTADNANDLAETFVTSVSTGINTPVCSELYQILITDDRPQAVASVTPLISSGNVVYASFGPQKVALKSM